MLSFSYPLTIWRVSFTIRTVLSVLLEELQELHCVSWEKVELIPLDDSAKKKSLAVPSVPFVRLLCQYVNEILLLVLYLLAYLCDWSLKQTVLFLQGLCLLYCWLEAYPFLFDRFLTSKHDLWLSSLFENQPIRLLEWVDVLLLPLWRPFRVSRMCWGGIAIVSSKRILEILDLFNNLIWCESFVSF